MISCYSVLRPIILQLYTKSSLVCILFLCNICSMQLIFLRFLDYKAICLVYLLLERRILVFQSSTLLYLFDCKQAVAPLVEESAQIISTLRFHTVNILVLLTQSSQHALTIITYHQEYHHPSPMFLFYYLFWLLEKSTPICLIGISDRK